MALNDRQLKILKVIAEGNITGDDIVNALGSSMQMTSYYLTTMADDGYLKVAKVYDNATREFLVVRAYLTDQGKDELAKLGVAATDAANPTTKIPATTTSESNLDAIGSQDIDYVQLGQSIAKLKEQCAIVPDSRREFIEVYLDDLATEVNVTYRRKILRIKAYFLAILNGISPILKQLEQSSELRQSLETIANLLGIKIQLPS